jgi:hypothetical protein
VETPTPVGVVVGVGVETPTPVGVVVSVGLGVQGGTETPTEWVTGSIVCQCTIIGASRRHSQPRDFPRRLFARTQLMRTGFPVARLTGNCESSGYAAW